MAWKFNPFTGEFDYYEAGISSDHNDLSGLQGGIPAEYYHLNAAIYGYLQNVTGDVQGQIDGKADAVHAARHQNGGADSLKLDDLASPDDTTDLDTSLAAHGLCPKLPGGGTTYLNGDGAWSAVESCFDIDVNGDLVPSETVLIDEAWETDGSGDLMPREAI